VIDEDVLAFIRGSIKSVWALELLLFVRANAGRAWSAADLVRELRSSQLIVDEILHTFQASGLMRAETPETYRYAPASHDLEDLTRRLESVYAHRPTAVVKAIISGPNEKLQTFSDAFRLKRD